MISTESKLPRTALQKLACVDDTTSNAIFKKGITMLEDDAKALVALAGTAASAVGAGSIVVAEITAPAAGILGVVGLTTTTTVALPVAGLVAAGSLIWLGLSKAQEWSGK